MTPEQVKQTIAEAKHILSEMPGVLDFELIGSATYIPEPSDVDFAVMLSANEDAMEYATQLCSVGWDICGDYDAKDGKWCAVRRGDINFMLTHDFGFFERYKAAMEVCKALRLQHKQDRIAVCRIVRDGYKAGEVLTTAKQAEHRGMVGTLSPDPHD